MCHNFFFFNSELPLRDFNREGLLLYISFKSFSNKEKADQRPFYLTSGVNVSVALGNWRPMEEKKYTRYKKKKTLSFNKSNSIAIISKGMLFVLLF